MQRPEKSNYTKKGLISMFATILESFRKNRRSASNKTRRSHLELESLEKRYCPTTLGLPILYHPPILPAYTLASNGNLYHNIPLHQTLIDTGVKSFQLSSNGGTLADLHTNGDLDWTFNSGATFQTVARLVNWYSLNAAGTTVSYTDWFYYNMQNPGMQSLARADFLRDDSITRSDMMGLFTQAETGGTVSAAAFHDLQTLVANPSTLNIAGYVDYLTKQVVDGDPANAHFQSISLGNLYAGSGSWRLQDLVDKWFLGMDHPTESASVGFQPYAPVSGPLFTTSGPSYLDVEQGQLNDCTVIASMAEVAARDTTAISNMFIANGDGTWTVRFYENGTPVYVTVDSQLPGGGGLYDHPIGDIWVALAEKAYAQLNEEGWLATVERGVNSYSALDNGNTTTIAAALQALSGMPASTIGVNPTNIASELVEGMLVVLGTGNTTTNINVEHNHAYAVIGYNSASTTPFTLFNPWGINGGTDSATGNYISGEFSCTASFLSADFFGGAEAAAANGTSVGLNQRAELVAFPERTNLGVVSDISTSPSMGSHSDTVFTSIGLSTPWLTLQQGSLASIDFSQLRGRQREDALSGADQFFSQGAKCSWVSV
jgi:Calpain family cysteine protease